MGLDTSAWENVELFVYSDQTFLIKFQHFMRLFEIYFCGGEHFRIKLFVYFGYLSVEFHSFYIYIWKMYLYCGGWWGNGGVYLVCFIKLQKNFSFI